ncbi:hypothetical protein [Microbulbifer sp. SAOS-129_SWC]|uniref:hypothetical protein n=1 Tax=Microbulbifer sp. SAOS-129_SWC TaxID=3145235 RepID=UPI003217D8E2
MKACNKWLALGLLCGPLSLPVLADGGDDLDVTVTVVDADGTAEDAANVIELPEGVSEAAKEAAAPGLAIANAARSREMDKEAEEAKAEEAKTKIDASKISEDDVKAIIADARSHSEQARANAEAAVAAARENADGAREAAEEALKNALSGADLQGSMADVKDILDNLPDDVKANLPDDLESILEDAMDHAPEAPETPETPEAPTGD